MRRESATRDGRARIANFALEKSGKSEKTESEKNHP